MSEIEANIENTLKPKLSSGSYIEFDWDDSFDFNILLNIMSDIEANIENTLKPKLSSGSYIEFDWDDISVGSVEYPGQSGMTVVLYNSNERRLSYYISKRGKDIGGFVTDIINRTPTEENSYNGAKALALVGGSTLGLEGICGLQRGILEDNVYWFNNILTEEERSKKKTIPLHERIMGACCYTKNLSMEQNYIFPDIKMGEYVMNQILTNSRKETPLNKVYLKQQGVGLNSSVSKLNSTEEIDDSWIDNAVTAGVGSRFIEQDGFKALIIINLNSIGVIHDNGKLLHDFPKGAGNKGASIDTIKERLEEVKNSLHGINSDIGSSSNTTISIIITNMKMEHGAKESIAEEFHDEIESMVYPYGTLLDGDTMFLASTDQIDYDLDEAKRLVKNGVRESIKSVFEPMDGGKRELYEKSYRFYKNKYAESKKNE